MRKITIISLAAIVACIGLIVGCEQQGSNGSNGASNQTADVDLYKLAHMNGCIECHRVKSAVIGPSWQEIADRYKDVPLASAREMLVERVKKGSKGNWITWKAPEGMPPMERRVSEEHIVILVNYILSLNRAPGIEATEG